MVEKTQGVTTLRSAGPLTTTLQITPHLPTLRVIHSYQFTKQPAHLWDMGGNKSIQWEFTWSHRSNVHLHTDSNSALHIEDVGVTSLHNALLAVFNNMMGKVLIELFFFIKLRKLWLSKKRETGKAFKHLGLNSQNNQSTIWHTYSAKLCNWTEKLNI